MKKNDQNIKKVALRWLKYSNNDFTNALHMMETKPESTALVCWLCQQSAEKAIKAALVLENIRFPFTHDLEILLDMLPETWMVKHKRKDLDKLGVWTLNARYPGDWPEPTYEDAIMSKSIAESIHDSVVADFKRHGIYLQ